MVEKNQIVSNKEILEEINREKSLFFLEISHLYFSNGVKFEKSVSKLANIKNFDYNMVSNIEWHIKYGNDIHLIMEWLAKGYIVNDSQLTTFAAIMDKEKVIEEWNSWFTTKKSKETIAENIIACDKVAGKFDLLIKNNHNQNILIDYKTSAVVGLSHKIQVNIYSDILENDYKIPIHKQFILQWHKYQKKLIEHEIERKNAGVLIHYNLATEELQSVKTLKKKYLDANLNKLSKSLIFD